MASRSRPLSLTILVTGFGPFPGAPFNPTGPMVERLARLRRPALTDIKIVPYVFPTSYAAVDRELPRLIAEAQTTRTVDVRTGCANEVSAHRDARAQRAGASARCLRSIAAPKFHSSRRASNLGPAGQTQSLFTAARNACVCPSCYRAMPDAICATICVGARPRHPAKTTAHDWLHFRPRAGHARTVRPKAKRHRLTLDDLTRAGSRILLALAVAARR